MAKLNAAARNALPASDFAEPAQRKYPVENKGHAANAKARASQAVNAGRMSKGTEQKIDSKANAVLGKGPSAAAKGSGKTASMPMPAPAPAKAKKAPMPAMPMPMKNGGSVVSKGYSSMGSAKSSAKKRGC